MQKLRALTGDRPTGPLHLGHYVGSLKSRLDLQDQAEQFIMIADVQALTDNFDNPSKVIANIVEVAKDYIAVGIDPNLCTIFIQSQIPSLYELTVYYMNLVSVGRLERNPTVKAELQQKGFGDSIPVGFFCYPISQAADITIFDADIVPVGEDQIPMIEQCNEIADKFNRIYNGDYIKRVKAHLSKISRLPGIDGKAKASKSLGNAIMLSQPLNEVKQKVFAMYTDPHHLKVSDPGQVEGNVVFTYLDAFMDNKEELDALKAHYRKGGLGDVTIKNKLNHILQEFLTPIQAKRASLHNDDIMNLLHYSTNKANDVANQTMLRIQKAIGVRYW